MAKRGPKKRTCKNCGERIYKSNIQGYCLKCIRERARMLKAGTLKPKFIPRVRVLIDKDGNRTFLG